MLGALKDGGATRCVLRPLMRQNASKLNSIPPDPLAGFGGGE